MSVEADTGDRIGHLPEDDSEQVNGDHPTDRNNLLGVLREVHAESKKKDYKLDLEVPGMRGLMMLRFRPYNTSKAERKADALRKRMEAGEPIMLDAACDTLADACAEVFVRESREGKWEPLDDEDPVKLDARLGELLQFPNANTPRKVVKILFPTEQTITSMAMRVTSFLTDVNEEVDEEALGE